MSYLGRIIRHHNKSHDYVNNKKNVQNPKTQKNVPEENVQAI